MTIDNKFIEFSNFLKEIPLDDPICLNITKDDFNIQVCHEKYDDNELITLIIDTNYIMKYSEIEEDCTIRLFYKVYNYIDDSIGEKVFKLINNLKFDKFFGCFVDENDIDNEMKMKRKQIEIEKRLWPDFFENFQCSVCLEPTQSKTNCNHYLCYICWEKILKMMNKCCPQCRQPIIYENSSSDLIEYANDIELSVIQEEESS